MKKYETPDLEIIEIKDVVTDNVLSNPQDADGF